MQAVSAFCPKKRYPSPPWRVRRTVYILYFFAFLNFGFIHTAALSPRLSLNHIQYALVGLQRGMYRKCVGISTAVTKAILFNNSIGFADEECQWKCDSNFGDFHVFTSMEEWNAPLGLQKTSTTFGLMKPFEIPLVKLRKYARWSCLKQDSFSLLLKKFVFWRVLTQQWWYALFRSL